MTRRSKYPTDSADMQTYHTVADTVGMVPNMRMKDNVFQLICVVVLGAIGAIVGYFIGAGQRVDPWVGPVLGLIAGVIAGTFLSGIILMVLGWVRAAKRLSKK